MRARSAPRTDSKAAAADADAPTATEGSSLGDPAALPPAGTVDEFGRGGTNTLDWMRYHLPTEETLKVARKHTDQRHVPPPSAPEPPRPPRPGLDPTNLTASKPAEEAMRYHMPRSGQTEESPHLKQSENEEAISAVVTDKNRMFR